MPRNRAFNPQPGGTVNLTATTSSGRVAVQSNVTDLTGSDRTVRLHNSGDVAVFVRRGDSTVAASITTDMPIASGTIEIFSMGGYTHIAAITESSTAKLYVTPGEGL